MTDQVANILDEQLLDLHADGGPRLLANRCQNCSYLSFPPSTVCPECWGEDQDAVPLSRSGNLYTYSVIHIAPKGWKVPYIIGYVDLPEGVRIFTHISTDNPDDLQVDMPVRLDIGPIKLDEQGEPVNGFRFVPDSDT